MFKITLYDACCCPICDGTVSYFVDSLEEFEKNWLPNMSDREKSTVERYMRSKSGEIVTDYYSDSEELNIVQSDDNSKVIEEVEFEKKNFDINLYNAYNYSEKYYIFNLKYKLRKILFKNQYYIIAKYKITGISQYNRFNVRDDENKKFENVCFYGNHICNVIYKDENNEYSATPDLFKDDVIDSFVWHEIFRDDNNQTLSPLNEEELQYLLRDIIGEAG